MSQCVPSWDVDDNLDHISNLGRPKINLRATSNSMSSTMDVPKLDYEVAELTWKNGQVAMHGLGPPRVVNKLYAATPAFSKYTWDKPRAAETLEAIVNQATFVPNGKSQMEFYADDLVPWLDNQTSTLATGSASASVTMAMDALVPSSNTQIHTMRSAANGSAVRGSTRVASCSGDQSGFMDQRVACGGAAAANEWSSYKDHSVSGSATFGMESGRQITVETCEKEYGVKALTSTSIGSPGNTNSGKRSTESTSPDENDFVGHSKRQKVRDTEENKKGKGKGKGKSSERGRAAAVHNQSERRRRDKINQKMKTLQKLVPNANKTDKASMLDEVIEYLKQLQAQIHMMSRMNMSPMMMPLAMQQQQQIQMAMMNPMGMGIGMGTGIGMGMGMGMGMPGVMDLTSIGGNRSNIPGMPTVFHPSTFMQPTMATWDMHNTVDRVPNQNDPMAAFLACQSQPMTIDGYSRMAALFQEMQNQPCYSGLKNN